MDPTTIARLALLTALLAVSGPGTVSAPPRSPAAGTPQSAVASQQSTYIVQPGDTLYAIALKFGTTIQALQEANNIADPAALAVGRRLIIPGRAPTSATAASRTATPSGQSPTRAAAGASPPARSTAGSKDANHTIYVVKRGDALATIAQQFGVTVEELVRINNLANANLISVGQSLVIPNTGEPLPDGIALDPPAVRQGQTLEIRVTAPGAVSATGTLDQQELTFTGSRGNLRALAGISRCAYFVGQYPVQLTLTGAQGDTRAVHFNVRVNPYGFPVEDLTLTPQMSSLLDPAVIRAEDQRVSDTVKPFRAEKYWSGVFRSPLSIKSPRVSSVFGERRSYNGGQPGQCGHEGQDYAVEGGTPVYAPASGVVVLAAELTVRGNVVLLDHGRGVYSGYYHLSELDVRAGRRVNPGDPVGKVGTTGFSTGDHLHWSMWVNGIYVDPLQWTEETFE
jgi:murein DD-endopeptidase MepM/ murein hydrolase activator NlpD